MKQQRLLKATSRQYLCIFCAHRLGIERPSSRRKLDSNITPAYNPQNGGFGIGQSSWTAYDAQLDLSPAEQAEKANRLRQNERQELQSQKQAANQVQGRKGKQAAQGRRLSGQHTQRKPNGRFSTQSNGQFVTIKQNDVDSLSNGHYNGIRLQRFPVRENGGPPLPEHTSRDRDKESSISGSYSGSAEGNQKQRHRRSSSGMPITNIPKRVGTQVSVATSDKYAIPRHELLPHGRQDLIKPGSGIGWGIGGTETKPLKYSDIQDLNLTQNTQGTSLPSSEHNQHHRANQINLGGRPGGNSPSNEEQASTWKHLRRQDPDRSQTQSDLDDTWVDRSFEEHRLKRAAASSSLPVSARLLTERQFKDKNNLFSNQTTSKRCARCGEMGHIARQCPRRSQILCHSCGRPGHLANQCPSRTASPGSSRKPQDYLTDPYAEELSSSPSRRNSSGGTVHALPYTSVDSSEPIAMSRSRSEPALEATRRHATPNTRLDLGLDPSNRQNDMIWRSSRVDVLEGAAEEDSKRAGKALRREQWASDEDTVEDHRRDPDRRGQRRYRRKEFDEYDDEQEFAREEARARKQARQAKKEANKKAAKLEREARKAQQTTPIALPEFISVQNLSQLLGVRYDQFVERLEEYGYDDVFPGKILNTETSSMIAMEYNFEPSFGAEGREEEERDLKARPMVDDTEFLPVRPPVVTIMGHVDHGKTTILDYLRKSSVAAGEAGGITQHIGAFSVPLASSGKTITFLDTPGHAAFLAMRQRGANVTDIVILVVAADDSVKPQTLEAIKHAKAAGVPIIVAINKVDKEEADVQRCKQDLARHGVEIEDFGGETQVVEVSGKTGEGMDDLEETIVTLSEILDHRADTDGDVEGWVLEATTKKAGRVATVLVRRGTLRPGSVIVAGKTWARVKTLRNEGDRLLEEAGPGVPVEVDGWKDQPAAGDEVLQASSERKASSVVEYRLEKVDRDRAAQDMEAINESRRLEQEKREKERAVESNAKQSYEDSDLAGQNDKAENDKQSGQLEIPFVVKADVSGSAEAVSAYILGVSSPLITPKVLYSGVGAINESDIELASVAQGCIIAFNLRSDPEMQGAAEAKGVKVLENNIIYRVLDEVKAVLEDKLPPLVSQKVLGEAEIATGFEIGVGGRRKMKIAGCKVRNGVIAKNSRVRVTRKGEKIYDGKIDSLKNVKKDVQEMRKGSECGVGFEEFEGFEAGDQIQTYEEVSEKRKL